MSIYLGKVYPLTIEGTSHLLTIGDNARPGSDKTTLALPFMYTYPHL